MLALNDLVHIAIIENGYWKDACKGKIVGETPHFWVVESGSHHFWNTDRCAQVTRRFAKTGDALSKRERKAA